MRKIMVFEIEVEFTGDHFVERSTGTDEMNNVEIDSVYMFDREWSAKELRGQFGELADCIEAAEWNDDGDWE